MLKRLTNSSVLITAIGILLLSSISQVQAGIGVSPALIEHSKLRPGNKIVQEIVISQSEPNDDLNVTIEPELGEANTWLSYDPGAEFTIPKGQKQFTLKMAIDPPSNAQLKQYNGVIRIKATPKSEVSGGISVVRGARLEVKFATTNEDYIELIVRALDIDDTTQADPIKLKIRTENKGNVAAGPTKATIDVLDLTQKPIASLTSDKITKVNPGETAELVATFDHQLKPGEYFAKTTVYHQDQILRQERLVFRVSEAKAPPVKTSSTVKNKRTVTVDKLVLNISLVVLFITGAGIAFLMIRKRKQLTPRQEQNLMIILSAVAMLLAIASTLLINYEALFTEKEAQDKIEIRVLGASTSMNNNGNSYNIYTEPLTSASILTTVNEGETLSVVSSQPNWYKVRLTDGREGWIPASSVKATNQY